MKQNYIWKGLNIYYHAILNGLSMLNEEDFDLANAIVTLIDKYGSNPVEFETSAQQLLKKLNTENALKVAHLPSDSSFPTSKTSLRQGEKSGLDKNSDTLCVTGFNFDEETSLGLFRAASWAKHSHNSSPILRR